MDNGSTQYALLVIYERKEKTTTGTLLFHKEIVRLLNGNERCKYLIILETDPISKKIIRESLETKRNSMTET